MERLFDYLKQIDGLLEQIATITTNQTTVLIQEDSEEVDFELMEEMVEYKGQIITTLEQIEEEFNKDYARKRNQVQDKKYILAFKKCVANILEKKQMIQELEKNNLIIMQSRVVKKQEQVRLPKPVDRVVAAYKRQQR